MSNALEIALSIADAAEFMTGTYDPFDITKAAEEIYERHDKSEYSVTEIADTLKDQIDSD